MKIGIIGGGLTGLTTGYLLSKKGLDFEVLEKEEECGGLMRTLQEDGFTFDYGGSHVIFSKNKEGLNFMLSLLGDNKIRKRRNTKVLHKGFYVKYPFENGLSDLPKKENFECLYSFIQNLISKEKGELRKPNNLKEWFCYNFGRGMSEKYLIPYNEKIWKHPVHKINIEWVERVPDPPIKDIIKSSLGIETEGYTHQLYFYYPKKGGIKALIESMEEKIENNVITEFEAKQLRKEDGKWVVSNGKEEKVYSRIISTMPIQRLIESIEAPKEVKNAAHNLKYVSLVSVMIGLNVKKINNLSWLYIPDKNVLPHRVSFPSNYSPYVAPHGKSSVLSEITCNIGSKIWKMKNEDIMERAVDDLHQLKIINKTDVCFAKVKRSEYAYVITDMDSHENMRIVKNHITMAGIDLLGRFAEFKYLNMDACVDTAMNYVKNSFGAYRNHGT